MLYERHDVSSFSIDIQSAVRVVDSCLPCEDIVFIASVKVYVLVGVTLIIKGGDVTLGNNMG